ncbi:MAG: hypothetical protein BWY01_01501 [Synergistetes bacterium ADurb.Bin155]|nr:MAG: hypothetical protein BWY01_01501 [Synergistetes bacterium ADurb.Bin155]
MGLLQETAGRAPDVRILPLEKLIPNASNPKKPLPKKHEKGLQASLETFGFVGVLLVSAPDEAGNFAILDGNTRYDELVERGIDQAPCLVADWIDTKEKRMEFVLAYDRHLKMFDPDMVMAQVKELIDAGEDRDLLEVLTAVEEAASIVTESVNSAIEDAEDEAEEEESMADEGHDSIVIVGPARAIANTISALGGLAGRMQPLDRLQKAIVSAEMLDFDAPRMALVVGNILAHVGETPFWSGFACESADQEERLYELMDQLAAIRDVELNSPLDYAALLEEVLEQAVFGQPSGGAAADDESEDSEE